MKTLTLKKFGPIDEINIEFGDLTVLVGGQAVGKSICLEMIKLIDDAGYIMHRMDQFGYKFMKNPKQILPLYFGAGKESIWDDHSVVVADGNTIKKDDLLKKKKSHDMKDFVVPAQRVMVIENGWPKPFMSYDPMYPFITREFSENIRVLLDRSYNDEDVAIFPKTNRINQYLRAEIDRTIFKSQSVVLKTNEQNRKILALHISDSMSLPVITWSSGQREFIPLLCGLYYCLPAGNTKRKDKINTILIEEVEMGLHPQAIVAVMLLIFELLKRGYKVILTTHSNIVLDIVWGIQELKVKGMLKDYFRDIFEVGSQPFFTELAKSTEKLSNRVYYLKSTSADKTNVTSIDISNLDPNSDNLDEFGWGGLSAVSGRIADIVGKAHEQDAV